MRLGIQAPPPFNYLGPADLGEESGCDDEEEDDEDPPPEDEPGADLVPPAADEGLGEKWSLRNREEVWGSIVITNGRR
eukprot:7453423-Pyramimonas_sp.AAC.1